MKYIHFIKILLVGLIVKLFTPLIYWFVYPFRHKARDIMYSYVIKNNIGVKDIEKYKVTLLRYKNVSKFKYLFYKWFVWIWLNDRVSHDTIDDHMVLSFIRKHNHSHLKIIQWYITKLNKLSLTKSTQNIPFYNGRYPSTCQETLNGYGQLITVLNTSDTNYDYVYYITNDIKKVFLLNIFGLKIGWMPCDDPINGIWYKLVIGKPIVKEMKDI